MTVHSKLLLNKSKALIRGLFLNRGTMAKGKGVKKCHILRVANTILGTGNIREYLVFFLKPIYFRDKGNVPAEMVSCFF